MRMKMGNKILWLMSCLLFCGQVVWGEKLTLQEAIQGLLIIFFLRLF